MRYFDFNDTYLSKEPAHPSDNISACLAAGEANRSTGKDLPVAIMLAYDIQCRLCDAASLRSRGWDHVCYGLVSSALGAGRLFGLSIGELTNAVNISLNSHIAMRQVRVAICQTGRGSLLQTRLGTPCFRLYLQRRALQDRPQFSRERWVSSIKCPVSLIWICQCSAARGGTHFKLPETYIKYYPAEYHSQSAIWAALEARKEIGGLENIVSVEIATHEAGYTILGSDEEKWAPKTKETADHSLPFIVGMALLEGKIQNSSYSQRNLVNPEIINFLKKITVREERISLHRTHPRLQTELS